jgi:predicted phosphodiesterase
LKIAIISDIHGNLTALESSLQFIDSQKVDEIYCLGDLVGYGPEPEECVTLIRKATDKIVLGNHDAAACGILDFSWFNPVAMYSLEWTARNISDQNREWLKNLPYTLTKDNLIFSHGMLHKVEEFYYDDELIPIYYSFKEMGEKYIVSFVGHSHKYNILKAEAKDDKLRDWITENELLLENDYKYIINAGSIGQPRDKNADSSVLIYDTDENSKKVTIYRIKYDIEYVAKKIIENNLPSILAERLFLGI